MDEVDVLFDGLASAALAMESDSEDGSIESLPEMEAFRNIGSSNSFKEQQKQQEDEEQVPAPRLDSRKVDPRASPLWKIRMPRSVPASIRDDPLLNEAISKGLPPTYNFDVHRTVQKIRKYGAKYVGLQLPDGLLFYATTLAQILEFFGDCQCTIMGDVVYGACCIDDLSSRSLGLDFLVHYGHSCLVPVDQTAVAVHYVHTEILFDALHLADSVRANIPLGSGCSIALMGTVQFSHALPVAKEILGQEGYVVSVPQEKPLSDGEVLGCTAPRVDADILVFVADGRFHLEAVMMANPELPSYRYDPYSRTLLEETFDHDELRRVRDGILGRVKKSLSPGSRQAPLSGGRVGLILGTLGRQGSVGILENLQNLLAKHGVTFFSLLLSDISPGKLAQFSGVTCWIQVACPRLSLDWGESFAAPLLSPFEAFLLWGDDRAGKVNSKCCSGKEGCSKAHPMDYYSNKGGPWANYGGYQPELSEAEDRVIASAGQAYGGSMSFKFWHMGPGKKLVRRRGDP